MRGAAAIWVAVHHAFLGLNGLDLPENDILKGLVLKGWLGVDLFFILSGFIISYTSASRLESWSFDNAKKFLARRFARIYPAHFFVMALFACVVVGARLSGAFNDPQGIYTAATFFRQLFLLNGLGIGESVGWNVPTWSISSEFLAYSLFPVLALAFGRLRRPAFGAAAIVGLFGLNIFLAHTINGGQKYMLAFDFVALRVLSEFVIGMALFGFFSLARGQGINALLTAAGVAGATFHPLLFQAPFYDFMYLVYFGVVILGTAGLEFKSAGRVFGWFEYLGSVSYSLYLVHSLVLTGMNQLFQKSAYLQNNPLIGLLCFIGLSVVFASLIYKYVEIPGGKILLERMAGNKRPKIRLLKGKAAYN